MHHLLIDRVFMDRVLLGGLGREELVGLVLKLRGEIERQRVEIGCLRRENEELRRRVFEVEEKRVKPFFKPGVKRRSKRPGRRDGHEGAARLLPGVIHEEKRLALRQCPECGSRLKKVAVKEKRYDEITEALERKKKGLPVKEGIKKYLTKKDGEWTANHEEIEEAEKHDGTYALFTSMKDLPKEKAVKAYFEKDRIEKSFSTTKGELEIQPLSLQLDKRIRSRVMLSFLAHHVTTNIETKLREKETPHTIEKLKETLSNTHKVHLHRGDKHLEKTSIMTEEQEKILKAFGPLS